MRITRIHEMDVGRRKRRAPPDELSPRFLRLQLAGAILGAGLVLASSVAHADPSSETTSYSSSSPLAPINLTGYGTGASSLAASTGYITPWLENAAHDAPTVCVDVAGAGSADGATVHTWTCNGEGNQSWILANSSQGNSRAGLANAIVGLDGKCLTTQGTSVVLQTCASGNANQEWIWNATTHSISGTTGCLATTGNPYTAASNSVTLAIQTCNTSNSNQQWMVHATSELHMIQPGTSTPYCLDIPNFASASGTNVDFFGCSGGVNQKWQFDGWGDLVGEWGLCLTATGTNGAVQTQTCNFTTNQAWTYNPKTGIITSTFTNQPLAVAAFTSGGAVVTKTGSYDSWDLMNRMPVPMVPQLESNWCWLAVSQMTMNYLGNDISPVPLECLEGNYRYWNNLSGGAYLGTSYDCCSNPTFNAGLPCNHTGDVGSVLTDWGYGYTRTLVGPENNDVAPTSFSALTAEITAGRPVPYYLGPGGDAQHANVLIGTDTDEPSGEKWVVVIDPNGATVASGQAEQIAIPYAVWSNMNANAYQNNTWMVNTAFTDVHFVGGAASYPSGNQTPQY
jgi:Ricin-type beta-trefoil lectin domain/Papain-like cysteine protease AvrRpt2